MVDQKLDFYNAERFCKSEFNGSLPFIRNMSEFNFIKTVLDDYKFKHEGIFIGVIKSN